jgi:hypothetical protein
MHDLARSLEDTVELRPIRQAVRQVSPPRRYRQPTTLSLGRRLRVLAGVSEPLLDLVPNERSRYTALGGVVLGTATIATFSMWMALTETTGTSSLLCLVPALIWGLFVLNFDRWLVSSATGTRWGPRILLLMGRLVLAAFFGIIIAEPLVLRIFQTAIEQNVEDGRTGSLESLTSTYIRCNPPPNDNASPSASAAPCAGYLLNLPADTSGVSSELAADQQRANSLQQNITSASGQQNQLNSQAAAECAGTSGAGFTGKAGNGPLCKQRQAAATEFAQTHPIEQQQSQLRNLDATISDLQKQLTDQHASFLSNRATVIKAKVAEQQSHQGQIGMLERFQALYQLTGTNGFLGAAAWCLSIFFILIDCMPALGKLLGGITEYDRLVERQSTSAGRIYDAARRIEEGRALATVDSARYLAAAQVSRSKVDADVELRRHEVDTNRKLDEQVEQAASQLLQRIRGHRTHGGDQ